MKTHAHPTAIKIIEELNERNQKIRRKPKVEAYSYSIWKELGIKEIQCRR